jgi:hypothetical protein
MKMIRASYSVKTALVVKSLCKVQNLIITLIFMYEDTYTFVSVLSLHCYSG